LKKLENDKIQTDKKAEVLEIQLQVSERAKRASLDEDEHTRDEFREMATDIMANIHSIQTNPLNSFDSLHSFCSCFIKNASRFARRSA